MCRPRSTASKLSRPKVDVLGVGPATVRLPWIRNRNGGTTSASRITISSAEMMAVWRADRNERRRRAVAEQCRRLQCERCRRTWSRNAVPPGRLVDRHIAGDGARRGQCLFVAAPACPGRGRSDALQTRTSGPRPSKPCSRDAGVIDQNLPQQGLVVIDVAVQQLHHLAVVHTSAACATAHAASRWTQITRSERRLDIGARDRDGVVVACSPSRRGGCRSTASATNCRCPSTAGPAERTVGSAAPCAGSDDSRDDRPTPAIFRSVCRKSDTSSTAAPKEMQTQMPAQAADTIHRSRDRLKARPR